MEEENEPEKDGIDLMTGFWSPEELEKRGTVNFIFVWPLTIISEVGCLSVDVAVL